MGGSLSMNSPGGRSTIALAFGWICGSIAGVKRSWRRTSAPSNRCQLRIIRISTPPRILLLLFDRCHFVPFSFSSGPSVTVDRGSTISRFPTTRPTPRTYSRTLDLLKTPTPRPSSSIIFFPSKLQVVSFPQNVSTARKYKNGSNNDNKSLKRKPATHTSI